MIAEETQEYLKQINEELIIWEDLVNKKVEAEIEKEVNDTKRYRNKSHLIEVALEMLKSSKNK